MLYRLLLLVVEFHMNVLTWNWLSDSILCRFRCCIIWLTNMCSINLQTTEFANNWSKGNWSMGFGSVFVPFLKYTSHVYMYIIIIIIYIYISTQSWGVWLIYTHDSRGRESVDISVKPQARPCYNIYVTLSIVVCCIVHS